MAVFKRVPAEQGKRKVWKTIFMVAVYAFALAGFGIIGAWAFYQLGGTRNKGAVDENYRYLMSVSEMKDLKGKELTKEQANELWMNQFAKLAAFGKFYPENARLILHAAQERTDAHQQRDQWRVRCCKFSN